MLSRAAIAFFVLLSLFGCSAAPLCPVEIQQDPHPEVSLNVQNAELLPYAACAATRWHSATGVRIGAVLGQQRAPHGVTVRYPPTPDGFSGDYDPVTKTAEISTGLGDEWIDQVLTHELGHALQSPEVSHLAWGVAGIMNGYRLSHDDDFIGTADIELICGGETPLVPCVWFRSER